MKIAVLGDTHFGARNDHPAFVKFFRKFYTDIFFPTLKERGIEKIIQMGDVFDRRKYINFLSQHSCRDFFFERVWQRGYSLDGLIGNHDTYYKNTNIINSPDLLLREYSERIHFYPQPVEINMGGFSALMIPWICDDNRQQTLDIIKKTTATVCFGHLELQGFEMYRGQKIDIEDALSPKLFDKFDAVYSGHFHHRSTQGNITYVGTPYEITWSDFDDPKGFHIFDTETREMEFIPNPYVMFHKLQYDDAGKTVDQVCDIDFSTYNETYVKVIVTNKTNPYSFDMFIDKLEKAGTFDVQVVEDHHNLDKQGDEEIINEAEDTLQIIKKSISQMDESVDKPGLESLMGDLYSDALKVE